jgi:PepSY-associated TM region
MKNDLNILKTARTWHTKVASILFIFFFIISLTSLLLGWKNLFADKIYKAKMEDGMGKMEEGKGELKSELKSSMNEWLPLESLKISAENALKEKVPTAIGTKAESINARLGKNSVRFTFGSGYNVQLNAIDGSLQSIDKKAPDWILHLHSGEIIDELFGARNGIAKKAYPTIMGLALFFMTLSGFWMWFKTKQMKKARAGKL